MSELRTRSDWSEEELEFADDNSSEFVACAFSKGENTPYNNPPNERKVVENKNTTFKNALNEFVKKENAHFNKKETLKNINLKYKEANPNRKGFMQKFNHNQLSSRGDFGEEKIQKKLKM
jgi:hypothetical protein